MAGIFAEKPDNMLYTMYRIPNKYRGGNSTHNGRNAYVYHGWAGVILGLIE